MGILKKMRSTVSSKANAALDRAIDPAKEIDIIILDMETQYRHAMKDLIRYKTDAKLMENSAAEQKKRAEAWEKRAMIAVKQGEDDTAKECLQRKRQCEHEFAKIRRDQSEAASYASELNNSRKKLDAKLRMLKLKKGSLATQIAAARSGGTDVLGQSDELFDKLEEAERQIDEEIFAQEAAAELDGEAAANMALEAALLKASDNDPGVVPGEEDPLDQLKAKMGDEKKLLGE
ncbi:MAG: PspA/IM30 family protein [Myxococcales bacterium]|nr:PspA/IM30 family protein [Myxococcales bacterium]